MKSRAHSKPFLHFKSQLQCYVAMMVSIFLVTSTFSLTACRQRPSLHCRNHSQMYSRQYRQTPWTIEIRASISRMIAKHISRMKKKMKVWSMAMKYKKMNHSIDLKRNQKCTSQVDKTPFEYVVVVVPRGMVKLISDNMAVVNIGNKVSTIVSCQCESDACDLSLPIGRCVLLGEESGRCVHCDHLCHELDNYSDLHTTAFQSKCRLEMHLDSMQCWKSRDLPPKLLSGRKPFSDDVAYDAENPKFEVVDESAIKFKRLVCKKKVAYQNQYNHVFIWYIKKGRWLQQHYVIILPELITIGICGERKFFMSFYYIHSLIAGWY